VGELSVDGKVILATVRLTNIGHEGVNWLRMDYNDGF
jgi:hypothetical protein